MSPNHFQLAGTIIFAFAILHTFLVGQIRKLSHRWSSRKGAIVPTILHLLSDVELVFGFWALLFLAFLCLDGSALAYLETLHFTESLFIFVVLTVSASRPILKIARAFISALAKLLPLPASIGFLLIALTIGPLLGSFITEPAAMTVLAFLLTDRYFESSALSPKFKASLLGLLFVNISIGGVLTPFAAPPVLMVSGVWGWDLAFMFGHFGYKGIVACVVSACFVVLRFRRELGRLRIDKISNDRFLPRDLILGLIQGLFLTAIVIEAHNPILFTLVFAFFIVYWRLTRKYQDPLAWKQGALVAVFLAGLVVLGGPQTWWLKPILSELNSLSLYLGSIGLTAIVDNAAITYLGTQVSGLADTSKYALVSGAVVGGGLSVIANAPNPIGYSILGPKVSPDGVNAFQIFKAALVPTVIAGLCFWLLP